MSTHLPLTFAYLTHFRDILIKRAAYQKYFHKEIRKDNKVIKREPIAPFYSMYNINEESLAKYRVVWKRMASKMAAVVLSRLRTPFGLKTAISTDTTSFFAVIMMKKRPIIYAVSLIQECLTSISVVSLLREGVLEPHP